MSSPNMFKEEGSPRSMFNISPAHSPSPWSPSLDHLPCVTMPQLTFPMTSSGSLSSSGSSSPSSDMFTPCTPSPTAEHIPRPPNAFLLFRSDFLKKGTIPREYESRQQNLSRIAGEIWRLMDSTEKQHWHAEAKAKAKEHFLRHPHYKFNPAARGTRTAKNKSNASGQASDEHIKHLRESFTPHKGIAPPSSRSRRPKKARSVEVGNRFGSSSPYPMIKVETPIHTPPSSPHSVPSQTQLSMQAPSPMAVQFGPRRPSTSLGFNHFAKDAAPSSFVPYQDENINKVMYNQAMFQLNAQMNQNGHFLYSAPHFDINVFNKVADQHQSQPAVTMEPVSPCTLPQEMSYAPTACAPSVFEFQASDFPESFIQSSADQHPFDNLDYYEAFCGVTAAEALASFGMRKDEVYLIKGDVSRLWPREGRLADAHLPGVSDVAHWDTNVNCTGPVTCVLGDIEDPFRATP
ncbi:hypothetical protein BDN70DRAFT_991091 [Pholiota conissans]|uniref:HMG box domain-containing protein n=1 Tax=Pholiota conissans TaxID=109636 RepID=A0A9P6CX09_9AGAR|nr:hypothetical protein BDN70DRAFT_991091 [Pholiota conissans]